MLAAGGITVQGSSHREALAILNEPCADNTDTYAWVSNGAHDKLYLIMDFNPLHEPGQGNQGLRACNGYRYEFHIGKGASLRDRVVYRVEFTNRLQKEAAPGPGDPLGGGNELLWQLTGGTETMKVTRIGGRQLPTGTTTMTTTWSSWAGTCPSFRTTTVRRPIASSTASAVPGLPIRDPTSREVGLYDQAFVDTYIHPLSNGGRMIAGQFDDPYQLDEKGIFDLVNLASTDLGGIPGARRPPAEDVFTGFNIFSIALEVPIADVFPNGIPHNGVLQANSTDSLLRVWSRITRRQHQTVTPATSSPVSRGSATSCRSVAMPCRSSTPAWSARSVRPSTCTRAPCATSADFGADILFPVLVRDAEALGIYAALGVPPATVADAQGPSAGHHQGHQPEPANPGRGRFHGRRDHAGRRHRLELPQRPTPGWRHGAEPQSGERQQRADQPDRGGRPGAGLAKGTEVNDKNYLDRFPFLALHTRVCCRVTAASTCRRSRTVAIRERRQKGSRNRDQSGDVGRLRGREPFQTVAEPRRSVPGQVVFDRAHEQHVGALGRRDLAVVGILVGVMEVAGGSTRPSITTEPLTT